MAFVQRIQAFVKKNKKTIQYHIIWWCIFYIVDYFFAFFINESISTLRYIANVFFVTIWFYIATYAIFLPSLPHIFRTVLKLIPFLSIFILLKFGFDVAIGFVQEGKYKTSFFYELWRFSTMSFYAFAYWIYIESLKEQKLRRETEAKLLKSEIDFLKAQINPHFLFNTLNFVYNDISKLSRKSGESILLLTKLMRYSVESTKSEQSTVGKEIQAIEEYINLQALRFGDKLSVEYTKKGSLFLFTLPPLILLSIVENAFKYGVIDDPENPIVIEIDVSRKALHFSCKNNVRLDFHDKETTSVGLSNIKRRLEMTYGENFELVTDNNEKVFEVDLKINWFGA